MNKNDLIQFYTNPQPIPSVFNEGFSQYETVAKLIQVINDLITNMNLGSDEISDLQNKKVSLEYYLNDLKNNRKLDEHGNFTGTLNGFPIVQDQTGLSTTVSGHSTQIEKINSELIDLGINVKNYGAIGDGNSHSLSEIYSSLSIAQQKYPFATSLTDEIDWCSIQLAINENNTVYIPKGVYIISEPIQINGDRKSILGHSKVDTIIVPRNDFKERTKGGNTVKSLIWYQADGIWNNEQQEGGMKYGGKISNLTLDCIFISSGIHFNRIITGQEVDNVEIRVPIVGIESSFACFGHNYSNVFVIGATQYSIKLLSGCNGITMNNVCLDEGDWNTPTHLFIDNSCYGISYNGGFIEQCNYGIQLRGSAQICLNGVDFEACRTLFIESIGIDGHVNPPSSANTCTFVGAPTQGSIYVSFGQFGVHNCNFIGGVGLSVSCLIGVNPVNNYSIISSGNNYGNWQSTKSGDVLELIGNVISNYNPTIIGGTSNGIGTYSENIGTYIKTGNNVSFEYSITWNSHTGTGQIYIPLPVNTNSSSVQYTPIDNIVAVMNGIVGRVVGLINKNTNYIQLYVENNGVLTALNVQSSGTLYIKGSYIGM